MKIHQICKLTQTLGLPKLVAWSISFADLLFIVKCSQFTQCDPYQYSIYLRFVSPKTIFIILLLQGDDDDRKKNTKSWSLLQFSSLSRTFPLTPPCFFRSMSLRLLNRWLFSVKWSFGLSIFSVSFGIFLALFFYDFSPLLLFLSPHCCNLIEWKCIEWTNGHSKERKTKKKNTQQRRIVELLMTIWIMGIM